MMQPQCPGPPTVPLSGVSSVSTCSLSVSLRKPATRPLIPCTSGFYLLTGFHRGPSSRPFTDSVALASSFFGASPEAQLPLSSFLTEYPVGPICPHRTLHCLISSHCVLFAFFPSVASLCGLRLLVPRPQTESRPLEVKVWRPDHSTGREFPVSCFLKVPPYHSFHLPLLTFVKICLE